MFTRLLVSLRISPVENKNTALYDIHFELAALWNIELLYCMLIKKRIVNLGRCLRATWYFTLQYYFCIDKVGTETMSSCFETFYVYRVLFGSYGMKVEIKIHVFWNTLYTLYLIRRIKNMKLLLWNFNWSYFHVISDILYVYLLYFIHRYSRSEMKVEIQILKKKYENNLGYEIRIEVTITCSETPYM